MGLFALSPSPMIVLGNALVAVSPPKPMEGMRSMSKEWGGCGHQAKPATEIGQGNRDGGQRIWRWWRFFFNTRCRRPTRKA